MTNVWFPTLRKYCIAAALTAAVTAPAAAEAATVVGATSITIKSALPDFLQISELLAFDFSDVNVALAANGGVATAFSQYFPGSAPEGGPAETNDGAYPTVYDYAANPAIPGLYHSGGTGANEYLTITFAAPTTLKKIEIYGRYNDSTYRDLYNVTVNGAGGVLFTGQLDARAGLGASITFDAPSGAPEPGAWALMIAGFGLAGGALRRRQSWGRTPA
jgi:hypothetical protein